MFFCCSRIVNNCVGQSWFYFIVSSLLRYCALTGWTLVKSEWWVGLESSWVWLTRENFGTQSFFILQAVWCGCPYIQSARRYHKYVHFQHAQPQWDWDSCHWKYIAMLYEHYSAPRLLFKAVTHSCCIYSKGIFIFVSLTASFYFSHKKTSVSTVEKWTVS